MAVQFFFKRIATNKDTTTTSSFNLLLYVLRLGTFEISVSLKFYKFNSQPFEIIYRCCTIEFEVLDRDFYDRIKNKFQTESDIAEEYNIPKVLIPNVFL